MKILALDLGLHCGYAYHQYSKTDDSKIVHGCWHLKTSRHDGFIKPLVRLKSTLPGLTHVDQVWYEQVGFNQRGSSAGHNYGGLKTVVEMFGHDYDIPVHSVHVKTLKKWATGNGNANKKMIMQTCETRLGIKVYDDNEADALWLLDYAIKNPVNDDK